MSFFVLTFYINLFLIYKALSMAEKTILMAFDTTSSSNHHCQVFAANLFVCKIFKFGLTHFFLVGRWQEEIKRVEFKLEIYFGNQIIQNEGGAYVYKA